MRNQINKILSPCSTAGYSEKVKRISDMKWAGHGHKAEQSRQLSPGVCQFCNNPLRESHAVFKESSVSLPRKTPAASPKATWDRPAHHVVLTGSADSERAQDMLDNSTVPEGTHIYPISACDVMTEEDLFYDGVAHFEQRSDDWSNEIQAAAAKRVAAVVAPEIFCGEGWGSGGNAFS